MFIYQLLFVTVTDKSLFELLKILIEVIWYSTDEFDCKRLIIKKTICYMIKIMAGQLSLTVAAEFVTAKKLSRMVTMNANT